MTIETESDRIAVQIGDHIFRELAEETKRLPRTLQAVDSPLSSAVASVFAKAAGKPLTIEKEETILEGTTTIQRSILEK